jgi:hypothetical protein
VGIAHAAERLPKASHARLLSERLDNADRWSLSPPLPPPGRLVRRTI